MKRIVSLLALVASTLSACVLSSCGEGPPTRTTTAPRSLLIVTIDTLRADRVGCYGYEPGRTPHIDGLARRGVTFETAFATAPITLPSHTSLMTGTIPPRHGVRNNGTHRLVAEAETVAETLSAAGFRTAAFTAAFVLDSQFGLDQGFELYADVPQHEYGASGHVVQRPATEVNAEAFGWIDGLAPEEPFFLWVHYFEPHLPRAPLESMPPELRARPYDGDVALGDRALGELLARLERVGRLDETLVVLTSDHGEGLGEHGEETHAVFVYQTTTHVPLIFAHESLPAGAREEAWVSQVDVVPTVLELLGVEGPLLPAPARSLAPCLLAGTPPPAAPVYIESLVSLLAHGWAPLRSVALDEHKWIDAPRAELYHLPSDRAEARNLAADEPERLARSRKALDALIAANPSIASAEKSSRALTEADRAALESLGYTTAEAPLESGAEARIDPKDGLVLLQRQQQAYLLFQQGRAKEALAALRQLVADAPANPVFRSDLGAILIQMGQHAEALGLVQDAIAGGFRTSDVLCNLGACQLATGAPGEAELTFMAALEIDSKHLMSLRGLGQARAMLGDTVGARASLETFLSLWRGDEQTAAIVRQQLGSLR